jgi:hypothetical protein
MRRAKPLSILERVARCLFCGRQTEASPLGHRENPLCRHCLPERMSMLSNSLGDVTWRVNGEYVEFTTEGSRIPR